MTTIGQYLDIETPLHKLHPLTKLLGLVLLMLIALLFNNPYIYMVQVAILVAILLVSRLPLKILFKSLWSIRFIFIFIFIFNMIFVREGIPIWQYGILAIYPKTILLSINLVFRLLLVTSYASILTLTTKPLDLTYAIEKLLKPFGNSGHIVGMILSIALRFIPTLQEEAYKIMKAQQSRGATFTSGSLVKRAKHLVSLLIPLFILSFSRAETLAVAMELRGYNPDGKRTRYHQLTWSTSDFIAIIFLFFYLTVAIYVKLIAKF